MVLGLAVLQMGFRRGRALIVTAVNLVTNQVLVVAGGLICLGERFPTEPWPFAARVLGLGGILAGIILLARLSAGTNGRVRTAEPAPLAREMCSDRETFAISRCSNFSGSGHSGGKNRTAGAEKPNEHLDHALEPSVP